MTAKHLRKLRTYARTSGTQITRAAEESDVDEIARWRGIRRVAQELERMANEALIAAEGGEEDR